jgi:hypothetical protein
MKSLTKTICFSMSIVVLFFVSPLLVSADFVTLSDITADAANATAANGVFEGNDDNLLTLLNTGGTVQILRAGGFESLDMGRMFSTDALSPETFVGTAVLPEGIAGWEDFGSSDGTDSPFTNNPDGELSGNLAVLSLANPFTGNAVISLKYGNQYMVAAFEGLVNVSEFEYDLSTAGVGGANQNGLSHATMFVPEPTSLLYGSVIAGFFITRRRRS